MGNMSGAVPLFPLYAFMAWKGKTFTTRLYNLFLVSHTKEAYTESIVALKVYYFYGKCYFLGSIAHVSFTMSVPTVKYQKVEWKPLLIPFNAS
jgi:hypothetical protein